VEVAREASAADCADLEALLAASRGDMTRKRGAEVLARLDRSAHDLAARVHECLESPEVVVAVGTIDGTTVGYGVMRISEVADGNPHAVVEELFVDPEARSVGVGEALMEYLIEDAKVRGALWIEALALPGDRATKNFFESQRMVARAIVVHRWLDGR
jgi:GNAT superfamily N-acetyltransferase|tara:strand:- start:89 stop:562 length:474 start_codon:yes stop_codon:yes gene_type:complete